MLIAYKKYKFIFGVYCGGKLLFRLGSGMPIVCTLRQSQLIHAIFSQVENVLPEYCYIACDIV